MMIMHPPLIPPMPPFPPDFDRMQPHERARAEKRFEEQMKVYRRQLTEHKVRMKKRRNDEKWNEAVLITAGSICLLAGAGVLFGGLYFEFGFKGPLVLIASCLAFALAVVEVKKRL